MNTAPSTIDAGKTGHLAEAVDRHAEVAKDIQNVRRLLRLFGDLAMHSADELQLSPDAFVGTIDDLCDRLTRTEAKLGQLSRSGVETAPGAAALAKRSHRDRQ